MLLEKVTILFRVVNLIKRIKSFSTNLFIPKITIDKSFFKDKIEINLPYKIGGSLTRLPKNHEIWLISHVIDNGMNTGEYYPQCDGKFFSVDKFPVEYDSQSGKWFGHISIGKEGQSIDVYAVIAPPTSHDLFIYYCKAGGKNNNFVGLGAIPSECKILSSPCRFTGIKK